MRIGAASPAEHESARDRWDFQSETECYTQAEPLGTTDPWRVYRCTHDTSGCGPSGDGYRCVWRCTHLKCSRCSSACCSASFLLCSELVEIDFLPPGLVELYCRILSGVAFGHGRIAAAQDTLRFEPVTRL